MVASVSSLYVLTDKETTCCDLIQTVLLRNGEKEFLGQEMVPQTFGCRVCSLLRLHTLHLVLRRIF
ncbi:MAG: hypothetical protein CSA33_05485 [Desulfobulbus propionicus]|nr:MAG: hypothetical protein CSA33_05485 [Desulfobulbus propionicus]